jgi:hypothetical protein
MVSEGVGGKEIEIVHTFTLELGNWGIGELGNWGNGMDIWISTARLLLGELEFLH